MVMHMLAN